MVTKSSKGNAGASSSAARDEHDEWLEKVDTSHVQPLKENWDTHAFWADDKDVKDNTTEAGKIAEEMASGLTPNERAESCKSAGNDLMQAYATKKVAQLLRQAVEKYSDGVAALLGHETEENAKLRCALLSNRSQANTQLENWRSALDSAEDAIKADPTHLKSYMRGANAAVHVKEWEKVETCCKEGLKIKARDPELTRIRERGKAGAEKHAAQQNAEQERKEERLRPLRKVAKCITSSGYRMTRPQFGFQTNTRVLLPWVEAGESGSKDVLHFPLMLYYPEKLPYHDTVEDACELDTISAHLDMMFGDSAPAIDWDSAAEYSRKSISVFYLSHAGTVLREEQIVDVLKGEFPSGYVETGCQKTGPKTSMMMEADENWTLGDLLNHTDYVMPGVPVLFVVAKGGSFYERAKTFDPYNWSPSADSPATEP